MFKENDKQILQNTDGDLNVRHYVVLDSNSIGVHRQWYYFGLVTDEHMQFGVEVSVGEQNQGEGDFKEVMWNDMLLTGQDESTGHTTF